MAYTDKQNKIKEYVDNLQLPVWNPKEELKDRKNFSCLIFAKRNSGKSFLLRDLMYRIKGFYSECYAFCETLEVQKDLFSFVPECNQCNTFDEDKIQEIFDKQSAYIKQWCEEGKKKEKANHICLIFDDFIGSPKVKRSKIFKDLFILSRHINICVICLSQSVVGIPKDTRRNADLVISFFIDDREDREALCRQYLSIRNDKHDEADAIMRRITLDESKPYQAMIIMEFQKAISHENMVRTYIAEDVPKFEFKVKPSQMPRPDLSQIRLDKPEAREATKSALKKKSNNH